MKYCDLYGFFEYSQLLRYMKYRLLYYPSLSWKLEYLKTENTIKFT
jgi:hypothetical protein